MVDRMTGTQLRRLRRQQGWTQVQVAGHLGVDPNTVARWERGVVGVPEPVARLMRYVVGDPTIPRRSEA
jgi:transcriptional regulator with XRE-family HTH domain